MNLAYQLVQSLIWAIPQANLETILSIAERSNLNPETVATQLGRKLENTRKVENRGGVAIIPIEGPIFRRANLFSELSSNATSVQVLATDFAAALSDPTIHSILFNVDSPGGEANGISELAQQITAARGKGKPIQAYIGGVGASGAYWLAIATDKITMHDSAYAGSIGVVSVHRPPNKNEVTFISSQSQYKRVDPTTDEGGKYIQGQVDKYGVLFINAVATMRGVTPEKVMSDFGQGGVMLGGEAVTVGMADALGTFEGVVATLQAEHRKKTTGFVSSDLATSATERENNMAINTELAGKIVAGLADDDKKALLAALGITEQPAVAAQPAQPAAQPAQIQTAPATTNSTDPAITAMLNRALTAECSAFFSEMKTAGRVTPAEEASAKQAYMSMAALPDQAPLNNYKASIQARPVNPMLRETVASSGRVSVLSNDGQGSAQGPTAETEAAEIATLCRMTPEGAQALSALKAGKTTPAWDQFAVAPIQ